MVSQDRVQAEAGRGIIGDRYHSETGTFSRKLEGLPDKEITLIEIEEIDQFNASQGLDILPGEFRRNIVTQGVRLNELIGKTFSVGHVTLKGVRLCEPCAHLAGALTPEVLPHLVTKGGLRAAIVSGGIINRGDVVELCIEKSA
jgi:MOSC domain-containing protein YiiM